MNSNTSFRDPAAFVFKKGDTIHRQINTKGATDYDLLMSSGLYNKLVDDKKLILHKEQNNTKLSPQPKVAYKIITPQQVPFISYPYEWSFSQLKDAALATLDVQKTALEYDMSLKDSSAYNIQFVDGRPVHIDTASFEKYDGNGYWKAYKQFCQHFLAPLALMAHRDMRMGLMLRDFIDGIPLDLAVKLIPRRGKIRPGVFLHVFLHSIAQQRYADNERSIKNVKSRSKTSLVGLLDNLERTVKAVRLPRELRTEWGDYYKITNYSDKSFQHKDKIIGQFVKKSKASIVFDMGGNDGTFSRTALGAGAKQAVCFDIDPVATEKNYNQIKRDNEKNLLPLILDLTNPSPAIGWSNDERATIEGRSKPQSTIVLALALVHHLAISNNLPFVQIADYFARLGKHLVIEFVPKSDTKVKKLLSTRKDIFDNYDELNFEKAMKTRFKLIEKKLLAGSKRTIYLFKVMG